MVTNSSRIRSIWAAFMIASAAATIGGCSKQEDAPAAATKGAATPPAAVTVATTPAGTGKLGCTAFAVESAKDARGAPLWQASGDVAGNAAKAAPSHVALGRTVLAACQTELGKHGYGVCVRDPSGQVGWMNHEHFLKATDPAAGLASITSLPACKNDVCTAANCSSP